MINRWRGNGDGFDACTESGFDIPYDAYAKLVGIGSKRFDRRVDYDLERIQTG
jgi:hypothetical protein